MNDLNRRINERTMDLWQDNGWIKCNFDTSKRYFEFQYFLLKHTNDFFQFFFFLILGSFFIFNHCTMVIFYFVNLFWCMKSPSKCHNIGKNKNKNRENLDRIRIRPVGSIFILRGQSEKYKPREKIRNLRCLDCWKNASNQRIMFKMKQLTQYF